MGCMSTLISTELAPAGRSLEYWRTAISDTFVDLDCSAPDSTVAGSIQVQDLADLQVSRVRGTAQLVQRIAGDISGPANYYLLGVQTRGICQVEQDGRQAVISQGSCALYDTTRPYTLQLSGGFEQLVLRLPRAALDRQFDDVAGLTAREISVHHAAGAVLASAVRSLARDIDVLPSASVLAMEQGIEHLVAAGLGSMPRSTSRHEQIKRYAMANLRDPQLGIASISQALSLSSSSIHRAFAAEGQGLMSWIWQQRIEGAHRELASGAHRGTITELAASWGFSDSAHFSRMFRRCLGAPPSQLQ